MVSVELQSKLEDMVKSQQVSLLLRQPCLGSLMCTFSHVKTQQQSCGHACSAS